MTTFLIILGGITFLLSVSLVVIAIWLTLKFKLAAALWVAVRFTARHVVEHGVLVAVIWMLKKLGIRKGDKGNIPPVLD